MSPERRVHVRCLAWLFLVPLSLFGEQVQKERDVALVLRVDSLETLQCEPLRYALALVNVGPDARRVPAGWASSGDRVLCTPEGGAPFLSGNLRHLHKTVLGWKELRGGAALHAARILLLRSEDGRQAFAFREPGRYRLKAQVDLEEGTLESQEVDVFVKPAPQAEAKALDMVQRMPFARALEEHDLSETSAEQAGELIGAHPSSMYADHARYFLGTYWRVKARAGDPGDHAHAAQKAYAAFGAVSPRIGALRLRALVGMGQVASYCVPDRRKSPEYKAILEELEAYKPLAKEIGLEQEAADILKAGQPAAH